MSHQTHRSHQHQLNSYERGWSDTSLGLGFFRASNWETFRGIFDRTVRRWGMSELPPELYQRWYYSYEEDTGEEEVYRPAGYAFPPARAARPSLVFQRDGTYVEYRAGPVDRAEPRPGRWEPAGGNKVRVNVGEKARTLDIVTHDETVLKIRK